MIMETSTLLFCMNFTISVMLVCSTLQICHARDTITKATPLNSNQTIISPAKIFELGFFTRQADSNRSGRYVGIWYYQMQPTTIVWVANGDQALSLDSTEVVSIAEDGNLKVMDKFTTGISPRSSNTTAKLRDTGNLELIDESGVILWQSFEHPTDTFLPGMKMTDKLALTSWIDRSRPGTGLYKFELDENEKLYVIRKNYEVHWKSGEPSDKLSTTKMPFLISSLLTNYTIQTSGQMVNVQNRTTFYAYNTTLSHSDSRLVLTSSGVLRFYQNVTKVKWREPRYPCSVYNACGTYGSCKNINEQEKQCNCLNGFKPRDSEEWKSRQYTDGCKRKTNIVCNRNSEWNRFFNLNSVKLDKPDLILLNGFSSEVSCSDHCLGDCQCQAYSFFASPNGSGRSGSIDNVNSGCWIWKKDLRDLQEGITGGRNLSIRIPFSDLNSDSQPNTTTSHEQGPKKSSHIKQRILIISTTVIATIVISILSYLFYRRNKARNRKARTPTGNSRSLQQPIVFITGSQATDTTEGNNRKSIDVSFFKFQTILVATDNFSDANKLGEGGFGPVYLGRFGDEQYLAVKRLSSHSGQGVEEFQNEVALIAKLQHRNLVRVLGYCVEKDERVLLYEYMPNKSLDKFIFNHKQSFSLDWKKRFDIILGVARGLLYLHQDSRLRIIHRDLKTSNILLDDEMNPKISDFGLARIVQGKQIEANTNRVVGTYGYMSPEYALEGLFSIKSDVFSFGVIILEIISGKRNTKFRQSKEALNLLGYAWKLWEAEKQLDLLDEALEGCCDQRQVSKCVNIGLLCVQEDPGDRPTMANVLIMLSSEPIPIPVPRQPAFTERRNLASTSSSSSTYPKSVSSNKLTFTMQEGR